jgi:hypothetical protein
MMAVSYDRKGGLTGFQAGLICTVRSSLPLRACVARELARHTFSSLNSFDSPHFDSVIPPAATVRMADEDTAIQGQEYGNAGKHFQSAGHGRFLMGQ